MKATNSLLVAGIMAVFCCSIGQAQFSYTNALSLSGAMIIYSNAFNGSAVSVDGTAPTVANSVLGGTNTATWNVVSNGATANLYQDGTIGITGDSYLLPFTPRSNYVYVLTASASLPSMAAGKWINWGFAQYATNKSTGPRFSDSSVNGYDFMIGTCGAGSQQYWAGPRASGGGFAAQLMPTAGTHVIQIILDTTGAKWLGAGYVDGKPLMTTNYVFSSNPPIGAAGMGQTTLTSSSGIKYNYFVLSGAPIVIGQQPVSAKVDAGAAFTNTVVVAATSPSYQWFNNGVPINQATNASLILSSVSAADAGTNYYVVVTNAYGAVTSAPVSLTVYTNPVIWAASPVAYTNPITLFGGATVSGTNYPGSSPAFSVSVLGGLPIAYQWLTNGVAVGGATNASFRFADCRMDSPTSFTCIISNSFGKGTNAWSVSYVPAPTAPYPKTILGTQPVGYWRLNEAEVDNNGDNGVLALDYGSGNNGIYTNVYLGNSGFTPATDPSETSVQFGPGPDSDAFGIQGIDFAAPINSSPTFAVEAWVNNGIAAETSNAGIVAKGNSNGEQFFLDVYGGVYRFAVRDAAGNLYSAIASIGPTNNTWHYLVGVCDEVNSNATLYVNGVPAATVAIARGSGLLATSAPMTIGARSSSPTGGQNDWQYRGYMNEVAVFNYPLSAAQVAQAYLAAGYSIPVSFVRPLPPTNVVYLTGGTLTIPATLSGAPPFGYYWTNLTTGAVLGSGRTDAYENLNATLAIPSASSGLSGNQLELVVTNASSSLNWFVTLFSPPPPVALEYPNPILYSNYFNGGSWSVAGMPLTAANNLVGGTNTAWTDALGTNDTGSLTASGVDACTLGNSWLLPFTPRAGYVYTVSASLTFTNNPGSWVGLGFAQRVPTNAAAGYGRFSDGGTTPPQMGPNGYDWIILTESTGNIQFFTGPGGTPAGGITNYTPYFTAGAGTHTVQIVLDTTGTQWKYSASVDGISTATYTYSSNPPIGAVGITQTALSAPSAVRWNYFALSQVAPSGVPPYLFAPLPPTSVTLLADTPLSIPATAFGSVPLGYYWSNTNTAALLGSGATNNMVPFSANLALSAVPSSWSGNTLALIVTNAYGTNISLVSLTVTNPINLTPTNIVFTVSNSNLYLSWPPDHKGWRLQAQTNAPSVGLSTNWADVVGATSTNQVVFPLDPANGSVFYRMLSP